MTAHFSKTYNSVLSGNAIGLAHQLVNKMFGYHKKPKNKKNNLSEGQTPNLAEIPQMQLEEPCFEMSGPAHGEVFSMQEAYEQLSIQPPMMKKFSYQYGVGDHDFGHELDWIAYGSANKSVVQHSIGYSGTTEDIKDNLSLGEKSRTGCKCKKIGCLKLYCECFTKGMVCGKNCICEGCSNTTANTKGIERARLEAKLRVPNCFKNLDQMVPEKVCNCQKSQCQKKYCECFSSGMSCNSFCNCKNCLNIEFQDRGSIKDKPRVDNL